MKYIKTYEAIIESPHKIKMKVANVLFDYLDIWFDDGLRVGTQISYSPHLSYAYVNITKNKNIIKSIWISQDEFKEPFEYLINWFKKDGLDRKIRLLHHNQFFWYNIEPYLNKKSITLFFPVDKLDIILDSIRRLIESDEMQIKINVKKYNL